MKYASCCPQIQNRGFATNRTKTGFSPSPPFVNWGRGLGRGGAYKNVREFLPIQLRCPTPWIAGASAARPRLAYEPRQLPPRTRPIKAKSHFTSIGMIFALLSVNFTPSHEDFCTLPSAPIFSRILRFSRFQFLRLFLRLFVPFRGQKLLL